MSIKGFNNHLIHHKHTSRDSRGQPTWSNDSGLDLDWEKTFLLMHHGWWQNHQYWHTKAFGYMFNDHTHSGLKDDI